ncbi:MAG: HD domain-containing protein, partial [Acidobacteria bacterium]|nr:HD domain-containing protein [Acidobacteriota bacterium]
ALQNAYHSTLKSQPAALEQTNSETYGPSKLAVTYSLRLGREYGLDRELMKVLEFGPLLHDIGVLRNPAHLSEQEWVRIREHPMHRELILLGTEFLKQPSQLGAQQHGKGNGFGYPLGLRGEDIAICAQIFAVADAFDAITSDCVYRRGKSYEAAVEELDQSAGKLFDRSVVAAFHRVPKEDWAELARKSRSVFRAPFIRSGDCLTD